MNSKPAIKVNEDDPKAEQKRAYLTFWSEMSPVVTKVVEQSFTGEHSMRNPTRAEAERRVRICKELCDDMRGEYRWSKARIKDVLPKALSGILSGLAIDLEAMARRNTW